MSALPRGAEDRRGVRPANFRLKTGFAAARALAPMLAVFSLPLAAKAASPAGAMVVSQLGAKGLPAFVALGLAALAIVSALAALLVSLVTRVRGFDQLREAVNVMPDGLVVWSADDRLLAWNDRFTEISEADLSKLRVGMPVAEFLQMIAASDPNLEPGDRESWVRDRKIARRRAGAVLERQTQSGRWLRIENRPTACGCLVAVAVDVTDFKRNAERLTEARDEAQAANQAKTDFLANISHEIRTPMNGVIGMNALLLRTQLSPLQLKFAEAVRESAEAMMAMINDILDLSRLEAGKVEIEQVDLNLETLVNDVVDELRPRAIEKSLDVAAFVDDGARGALRGDPTRLRQIIRILLSNALKFTEQGRVWAEVTSRSQDEERGAIRVEVHDTGIGLSPEAKSRLFQKFQQADESVTRRYGGAGLGLSISRRLVELMGGRIGAENRTGGGSTFWFEVPLGPGKAK